MKRGVGVAMASDVPFEVVHSQVVGVIGLSTVVIPDSLHFFDFLEFANFSWPRPFSVSETMTKLISELRTEI